jgi:antitoxin ParD1/3/4
MTITLTDEVERLINERVRSGAYASAQEVILTGLQLLKVYEERLAELKRDIQAGVEAIRQGRFKTCSTDADLDHFADEIISQAQERKDQSDHQ